MQVIYILAKVQISFFAVVTTATIKMSVKKNKGNLGNDKLPANCKWSHLYNPATV